MHFIDEVFFEMETIKEVKKILAECYPTDPEKECEFTCGTLFIQDIEPRGAKQVAKFLKSITGTDPLISILKATPVEPWPEYAFDL